MSREISDLIVNGMSCSHCENSIKKSVGVLNGVHRLKVDLKGKKVTVEYDPAKVNVKNYQGNYRRSGLSC